MNSWNFTGYLGRDAEQKFIQNGSSIVSFSVAVKSGYGTNEATTWVNCNLWGKQGEGVFPYLKKGTLVGISGETSFKTYEKKNGEKGFSLEARVQDLTLLGGKAAQGSVPQAGQKNSFDPNDDVPF